MRNIKGIAIIGAGNIGTSIAEGLDKSGLISKNEIILTRRHVEHLSSFKEQGFQTTSDNLSAVRQSEIIIICVEPQQARSVIKDIAAELLPEKHILISVVTGLTIFQAEKLIEKDVPIVRAMPNTAISIGESITCLATRDKRARTIEKAQYLFNTVGKTIIIDEEQMSAATALGACGIAFFLRAIRAASQGGIEIGFNSEDALKIAAQTAKGAASLIIGFSNHPEYEIDRVTTPKGCTISGLNQMEHDGFSSAMIKGIITSAEKAAKLYPIK
ncbi:MAG: pyrroline-5-carboxylate reductase [Candidatus Marinimicrobia bacterium]|nr:pyrroline-5-carboxylate reductase [Candidatus Neomarinimicrobiota bacterium]